LKRKIESSSKGISKMQEKYGNKKGQTKGWVECGYLGPIGCIRRWSYGEKRWGTLYPPQNRRDVFLGEGKDGREVKQLGKMAAMKKGLKECLSWLKNGRGVMNKKERWGKSQLWGMVVTCPEGLECAMV